MLPIATVLFYLTFSLSSSVFIFTAAATVVVPFNSCAVSTWESGSGDGF